MAVEAGVRKLAEFQLFPPSSWILKVVQSAVAWGAERLVVRQSRSATSFTFDSSSRRFALDELGRALQSTNRADALYIDHLTVALRSVGSSDQRGWRLTVNGEEGLAWDGQTLLYKGLEPGPGPCKIVLTVDFPPADKRGILGRLFRGAGRARDEYMQAVEQAYVCPIPLTFDGRRLDRGHHHRDLPAHTTVSCLCLGIAPATDDETATLPLPAGLERSGWRPTDRFSDGRVFFLDGDPKQGAATSFWKLHFHYRVESFPFPGFASNFSWEPVKTPSSYHWVTDGILCHSNPIRSRSAISVDLYLSGQDLETDISGLSIIDSKLNSSLMMERQEQARTMVGASAERLVQALDKHISLPAASHVVYFGAMLTPFIYGAAIMTPWLLFIGVAGAGPMFVTSAVDKAKLVDYCESELRGLAMSWKQPAWD